MDFDTSFHMTIGGKPVSSDSLFDVLNPATEKVLAQAPNAPATISTPA